MLRPWLKSGFPGLAPPSARPLAQSCTLGAGPDAPQPHAGTAAALGSLHPATTERVLDGGGAQPSTTCGWVPWSSSSSRHRRAPRHSRARSGCWGTTATMGGWSSRWGGRWATEVRLARPRSKGKPDGTAGPEKWPAGSPAGRRHNEFPSTAGRALSTPAVVCHPLRTLWMVRLHHPSRGRGLLISGAIAEPLALRGLRVALARGGPRSAGPSCRGPSVPGPVVGAQIADHDRGVRTPGNRSPSLPPRACRGIEDPEGAGSVPLYGAVGAPRPYLPFAKHCHPRLFSSCLRGESSRSQRARVALLDLEHLSFSAGWFRAL